MGRFGWAGVLVLIGGLLGAGAEGALGDLIFKPVFLWIGELLLNVATLGISSIRDGMYVDIAKGSYERAGVALLSLVYMVCSGAAAGFVSAVIFERGTAGGNVAGALEPRGHTAFKPRRQAVKAIALIILGGLSTFLLLGNFRTLYVVRAANHLEQFERIVAPFVPEDERLKIGSAIAQIRSRSDYVAVLDRMVSIAKANKLVIPDFDVF